MENRMENGYLLKKHKSTLFQWHFILFEACSTKSLVQLSRYPDLRGPPFDIQGGEGGGAAVFVASKLFISFKIQNI